MPTSNDIERFTRRSHSERLAAAHARRARDANGGRWNGSWSARQWESLLAEWDYTCAYCHQPFPPDKLTPDHRMPLVRGGKNALWNLLPACQRCNAQKGARTEAEYRAYLATKEPKKPMTMQPINDSITDIHDTLLAFRAALYGEDDNATLEARLQDLEAAIDQLDQAIAWEKAKRTDVEVA